jgi:hypothetical protein
MIIAYWEDILLGFGYDNSRLGTSNSLGKVELFSG